MVFDDELSINIILSGLPADYNQFVLSYQLNKKETSIMELYSLLQTAKQRIKKIDVPSTSVAHVLTMGHNEKKRKTSHSNWKGKAAQGKSDRGSKRKVEYEIAPTSDPKEAMCFYCNTKGHWKRSCPKYLKDLKDGKVEKGGHSGLKESRRLKHGELNLVMGNMKITPVTRIGKYELMLKSEVRIDLNNCCYSSEMTRNIISFLDLFSYKFSFDNKNGDILVYSNGCFMFKASPCKGIYETVKFSQLTPPRIPQLNGVAERRNRTLFDMGCEVLVRREAQDKLEARFEKCLFVGYPEESFGYLFYKPKDNVLFIARREVFLEREMISRKDDGSKIDLEEIQESVDEEPIVNTDTQQDVVTPIEPHDISLPIRKISSRVSKPPQFYYGFHIEEDKISDSTLSELDKPTNYKEPMATPEAAKWKEAMKSEIQSIKLTEDVFMAQPEGFENEKDRSKRLIGLSQDTYLDKTLKRFRMENYKKGNLPLYHGIKISKDLCSKTDKELDKMSRVPYASAIVSIMYAMTCTRPDVSFALSMKSLKQDTVADFTCESEYIAACEASKEAIWMKNFIGDLGVVSTVQDPIEIFRNNESAVALTKEPKDHEKSKHIKRKYHFVRSKVEEGHVIMKQIRSEDNPTDLFIKALANIKDKIKF
uniref:CCHC-type domain-containing protein n=1 Tax=Tanacetum cinerariifolium TaxID=118510 RepID=A0A6L2LG09_TANCI|nr:hypothetical protein [Tanacetum cinerariifolium]